MRPAFTTVLERLARTTSLPPLSGGLKGLEKESLRLDATGHIAQTPHPAALGSALTHPFITTDYSEALPELITPPFADPEDTVRFLTELHGFVHAHLDGELLLASSMPCGIAGDASIPIARYGTSNIGRMKHVYREGLAWRYGRAMQAIAGIHFNYSPPETLWPVLQEILGDARDPLVFRADAWFGLVRNVLRHGWLMLYLFGASPAFCRAFFTGREHLATHFDRLDEATLYRPWATSLRMSDIGYRNSTQSGLNIPFNSLAGYTEALGRACATPSADYQRIGVIVDGEYRQLNANVLQIENEYYNSVRPKQITRSGEKPTLALRRRGILYVELRSIDLNPFLPAGIDVAGLRTLETFLLWCLLQPSPPMDSAEHDEASHNLLAVAVEGRKPGLTLRDNGRDVPLRTRAREILAEWDALAGLLDANRPLYRTALAPHHQSVVDPEATPSARVLAELRAGNLSFGEFALAQSRTHAHAFRTAPLPPDRRTALEASARNSLAEQRALEAGNQEPFASFLDHYFAQG